MGCDLKLEGDEWSGTVESDRGTAQYTPKRFSSTSKRFRKFFLVNVSAAYCLYVGKYQSGAVSFNNNSVTVNYGRTLILEYVDIYNLGYNNCGGGYATFQWIGTLE